MPIFFTNIMDNFLYDFSQFTKMLISGRNMMILLIQDKNQMSRYRKKVEESKRTLINCNLIVYLNLNDKCKYIY